ncbi:hypothetical protein JL722_2996 [Aureococcus anophagefferens]|nr:hypothetical protein JL722_2996 [Aureococcus anophagefferens]
MAATAGPRKDDEMAFADAYELGTIERRVKIDDRKSTDNCFKVFFWLCVLSFVGLLRQRGGGDYWKESTVCYEMYDAGQWSPAGRRLESRRLGDKKKPRPDNIWEGFGLHPEIPVTLVCVVMVLCLSFVKLMEQFAKTVLFGAYFLEIGFLLGLGIYDFARASEATSTAIMFIIFGVLLAAYVFYVRARIASAAETVAAAAHSLLLMPSLLGFVFAKLEETKHDIEAGYTVIGEWSECEFVASDAANNALGWCYVVWCWMWYWASTTLMFFVSGCVAQHHFDATAPDGAAAASLSTLPCTLAKLALTTSSGTTSKIALVFEFIAWLRKKAKVSCWNFASPFFYVAVLLKCCVYSCLRLLTKFALIFHVITGDALWSSGRRTAKLVRKAGVDAMVLETTAMNAFGLLAYGLSLSVAFWMGDVYDKDVLGGDYDSSWRTFMLVAMCILLASPVFAMSLVLFIAIVVGGDVVPVWIPWCCAVFTGGAAAMFFYQAATALLTAADTMFICIALDKEHGVVATAADGKLPPLYAEISKQVAIPVKETEVPYATPTNASPV